MIQITDCLWNVFAKFICTLSRIHWEPLRRHVYETGARHAELYKEGRPAPLRNVDGRHIEGIGRRCMPVSLQGMPTPLIMSTHFTRGQVTLNRQKMLTLLIMPCPPTQYSPTHPRAYHGDNAHPLTQWPAHQHQQKKGQKFNLCRFGQSQQN